MSLHTVHEIELAIDALTPQELSELYQWFVQNKVQLEARQSSSTEASSGAADQQIQGKSFLELCEVVRGLAEDLEFTRNPSTGRPVDL